MSSSCSAESDAASSAERLDRPLEGKPWPHDRLHPALYVAELVGTALLVSIGLSIVIELWGSHTPLSALPLSAGQRRPLSGFLVASVGMLVAFSPLGRVSGAHLNPALTVAFWLHGKLRWRDAGCYVLAQMVGGVLGAACLLPWGETGAELHWAATLPAASRPAYDAVIGEIVCTFLLVVLVFLCAGHTRTRRFTPLVAPPLFALLSWCEAPLSGASANPARSFGPELLGTLWSGWWVYWVGPMLGAAFAVFALRHGLLDGRRPHQARTCHFGHPGGTLREASDIQAGTGS